MISEQEYTTALESITNPEARIDYINRFAWDIRRSYPQRTLELASQTQVVSSKLNYISGLAYSYRCSGTAFYLLSLYEKSLHDLQLAWDLFKTLGNKHAEATTIRTIGNIYHSIDEDEKSIRHYLDALTITEELGDFQGSAYNYGNIGYVYHKMGKLDEALQFMNKTVEILSHLNDPLGQSDVLNNIGKIYFTKNEISKAKTFFFDSLKKSQEINHLRGIANASTNIGKCFTEEKNLREGLEYHQHALATAEEMGEKMLIGEILHNMSGTCEKGGDLFMALDYYKRFESVKSEMLRSSSKATINTMRAQFDLDREKTQKELYRIKNIELADAYRQIEEKNNDITASIHYAKRIQDAILPGKNLIKKIFPDSLVIIKPRDIVSGDFFWSALINNVFVVAVADCTGHGIPGAFMSLIANDYLTQIMCDREVTSPGNALTLLDDKIRKNLNKEIQMRDGMDIAICAFHLGGNRLQYAGAKRPMIFFRDGILTEYPATPLSVGGNEKVSKIFNDVEFQVQKNDVIYFFSDGFTDQFGGQKGKKYKSKQFRELLKRISGLPMDEQKQLLLLELNNWQGNLQQVDDILVAGIRI